MNGETDLSKLIQNMRPLLHPGAYVFTSVKSPAKMEGKAILGTFREDEGTTLILEKAKADQLQLPYDFVASWITLQVHSSLEAVGLTAVFSDELARHGISCNVIAGYYHDHLFVAKKDENLAVEVLHALSQKSELKKST